MITKGELKSLGYYTDNGYEFYDVNGPQSMYNIREQSLYEYCEINGIGKKLAVVKTLEELIELYYAIFNEILENNE